MSTLTQLTQLMFDQRGWRRDKVRLVMKRLRDVKPGDIMIGKMHWTTLGALRPITGVRESTSRPGKLRLSYHLSEQPWKEGRIYRWPDFYVICVKQEEHSP